jgi:hypothetical protein
MAKQQPSEDNEQLRELKVTCMDNLLASSAVRVYFKDLQGRFMLVSADPGAIVPSGQALEERIGKTDFDFYSEERATAFFEDEQEIIRSGIPIVEKLQRETFDGRARR